MLAMSFIFDNGNIIDVVDGVLRIYQFDLVCEEFPQS